MSDDSILADGRAASVTVQQAYAMPSNEVN